MGDRQGGHQGAQQFGLARTGRADHQAVRTHAAVRRLLEIQQQRDRRRSPIADRHPQQVAGGPGRAS